MKKIIIVAAAIIVSLHISGLTVEAATSRDKQTISEERLITYTEEIGQQYNICPELLQAIAERESSLRIYATNGTCKGLMQISEKWHRDRMERLDVTNIYDAYGNILLAADYLAEIAKENGDLYYVLMRYNMKKSTADKLYEAGEYTDYAVEIAERAAELERLHGK